MPVDLFLNLNGFNLYIRLTRADIMNDPVKRSLEIFQIPDSRHNASPLRLVQECGPGQL